MSQDKTAKPKATKKPNAKGGDTRVLKYEVRHAKGVYKIGTPISELPEATVKELPKGYF